MSVNVKMFGIYLKNTTFILFSCVTFVWCFQLIPEYAKVTSYNEKYIENVKFYVKRHGRKSLYYLNAEGTIKHTWGNNITYHLIFFEYLHNEYRRSFVEQHFKLCDLVNKDPYIGAVIRLEGIPCPAPPKEYRFMNMTIPTEKFPNVFPFQKGRVEGEFIIAETGEVILHGYMNAIFKDDRKPPKLEKRKLVGLK